MEMGSSQYKMVTFCKKKFRTVNMQKRFSGRTMCKIGDSARRIRIIYLPALKPRGLNPSAIPDHHSMVKYIPDIYVRKIGLAAILSMMGGCVPNTHA